MQIAISLSHLVVRPPRNDDDDDDDDDDDEKEEVVVKEVGKEGEDDGNDQDSLCRITQLEEVWRLLAAFTATNTNEQQEARHGSKVYSKNTLKLIPLASSNIHKCILHFMEEVNQSIKLNEIANAVVVDNGDDYDDDYDDDDVGDNDTGILVHCNGHFRPPINVSLQSHPVTASAAAAAASNDMELKQI
ncbi:hypothetical protein M0804_000365 [Polistes exclamans]|nr:hypothetical protein M0804_000365 [Polistes exclamans]